ncbi:hypothetical protein [Arsenicibacter rosenii]|uniref:Uncharacterized protein n=1 Tax=Arsenicibacter rosenii TaxID=1750698 RepID=A0A1S2VI49_9BACT|nr:hypothetical protein [Arsenicibacter rosenii]OIN58437.1 hypothetical protein BLX24_15730 [Arsenicibacter rosenii]
MVHIITIETQNDTALEQVKAFAKKLGLNVREEHIPEQTRRAVNSIQETQSVHPVLQQLADLERKFPPQQVSKNFDFNSVVDGGINL